MTRSLLLKSSLACASALLALLTLVVRDWIEVVFRVDPDGGNGAVEWLVVCALAAVALVFATLARAELRARTA
jgi:hypothetical protein